MLYITANKVSPTMRASDKWDSARFIGIILTSGLYYPQAKFTSRPLAANANHSLTQYYNCI